MREEVNTKQIEGRYSIFDKLFVCSIFFSDASVYILVLSRENLHIVKFIYCKYSWTFFHILQYCLYNHRCLPFSSLYHCSVCACLRWCMWARPAAGQEVVIPKSDKMGSVPTQWTQTHSCVYWDYRRHTHCRYDIHPLTGSVNNGDTLMLRHLLFLCSSSVYFLSPWTTAP